MESFNEDKISNMTKDEAILNNTIRMFYENKQNFDYYKKQTDKSNKEIKEMLNNLNRNEFETDNGLIAKISIQNRESFNESALIEKLLETNAKEAIDLIPTINWDKVEDMIYNGKLDPSILAPYKEVKEVITLKVSKKKGE